MAKKIKSALISVFHKDGLDEVLPLIKALDIKVYSTGGTQKLLESAGITVHTVESLTSYPSILDGRVKTLHPKVFGGILAKREADHLSQLDKYEIPELDLVVVDLYPFEETLKSTDDESKIIEKIDIGGISLIRAAAKNFKDVVTIASKDQYPDLLDILSHHEGTTTEIERKRLAMKAFQISSHYDTKIFEYFNQPFDDGAHLKLSENHKMPLRYGENPHQEAEYFGDLGKEFEILNGKALSYNNLVDIDSAIDLMREFKNESQPTFAILKHTNSCGIAIRETVVAAYEAALAGDPISAFGGILICNQPIDLATAELIDKQFYEVLIAPDFNEDAFAHLSKKKKRILLKRTNDLVQRSKVKTLLGGTIVQHTDLKIESEEDLKVATEKAPTKDEVAQLLFANKVAKHLKSNTIVIAKGNQLVGMGCGQTSRVDACKQAIDKAKRLGFDLKGSVMASDAFFPFPDCVEIAHGEGIVSVIQPGGSINDKLSIAFCNDNGMSMLMTGARHFKH